MNHLVKILTNEDGDAEQRDWCYVARYGDSRRLICTGEVFGFGEGSATYEEKFVKRGGITCRQCLSIIKEMKSIKL